MKQLYEEKNVTYFEGTRADMVRALPQNDHATILEVGCGYGGTGELALKQGKCRQYFGVEISENAARVARTRLTGVLVGDAESLVLPWHEGSFDALILSEVLEHLVDPHTLLRRLHPLLREGAIVMASSPNVSQYRVIASLLRGRWDLEDSGVMDRTHLRWFTPKSYQSMFEHSGFSVDDIRPIVPFSLGIRLFAGLLGGRLDHLFMRQIFLIAHKPASSRG